MDDDRSAGADPATNGTGRVVLGTQRLTLRELHAGDAAFIHDLVNQPAWLRHIGDKGVRTLADAQRYILDGPVRMYARHGHGLWLVMTRRRGVSIGLCGLLKRDALEHPDLGFALLPAHWRQGYAHEAASAVMTHARNALGLGTVLAITTPGNHASRQLLLELEFRYERRCRLSQDADEVMLYASHAAGC